MGPFSPVLWLCLVVFVTWEWKIWPWVDLELRIGLNSQMRRMLEEIKENISWISYKGFPGGANGKESACQRRWCRRHGFNLWVGKIPYSKKWQPAPVFLPGKFHGQRSLESYDPWGCKELDVTEHPEKVMAGLGSQLELGWWIRQGRVQGFRNGWTQWIWRRHKGLLTLEEET